LGQSNGETGGIGVPTTPDRWSKWKSGSKLKDILFLGYRDALTPSIKHTQHMEGGWTGTASDALYVPAYRVFGVK
jgi:hypothetical protein